LQQQDNSNKKTIESQVKTIADIEDKNKRLKDDINNMKIEHEEFEK